MIETLRMGTRVVTSNPVWPLIRKQADSCHHTRYRFWSSTISVTVDAFKTDDPTHPNHLMVATDDTLTDQQVTALVEHIRADLTDMGYRNPLTVSMTGMPPVTPPTILDGCPAVTCTTP